MCVVGEKMKKFWEQQKNLLSTILKNLRLQTRFFNKQRHNTKNSIKQG